MQTKVAELRGEELYMRFLLAKTCVMEVELHGTVTGHLNPVKTTVSEPSEDLPIFSLVLVREG